jgi:hypothetical protein
MPLRGFDEGNRRSLGLVQPMAQDLGHGRVTQHLPNAIRSHEKGVAILKIPVGEVHDEMTVQPDRPPEYVTHIASLPGMVGRELLENISA